MATIQDIADEVGISKAAVSRILNQKGSFRQETIHKVQMAAKRLNYTGFSAARQEGESSMKLIAAIFPVAELPAFGYYVSLLEKAAYDHGYSMLLCSSLFDREKEDTVFDLLRQRMVNGVLMGSYSFDENTLAQEDFPLVTVGYTLSEKIPSVRSDDYSAGRLAARHLFSKGCRRPIYLTSFPSDLSLDLRGKGFSDELRKHGIEPWTYRVDLDMQVSRDFTGVISMMPLEHPEADGIFAETEELGMNCIQTYLSLGFHIPEDVRVIAYGFPFFSQHSYPQLSLIRENTELIARKAVALLVRQIEAAEGRDSVAEREILVPVSLRERKTT